jgi:hypothetical protein
LKRSKADLRNKDSNLTLATLGIGFTLIYSQAAFGGVIAPNLGSAGSFGLLGGTISNTGTSVVVGDVGAITTVTGFPPGTSTGTTYPAPSSPGVSAAYLDFQGAFNTAISDVLTPPGQSITDLTTDRVFTGNNVFTFGLTDVVTTANINLTFDAQNDSSEVFLIKVDRDLTVNGPLSFQLVNGATAANIYWIIGRTATISSGGGPVTWEGSILAGTDFTMSANPGGSGVLAGTIDGCVFAEAANTLAGTTHIGGCSASASAVPEPGTSFSMALGCLLVLAMATVFSRRRMQLAHVRPSVE